MTIFSAQTPLDHLIGQTFMVGFHGTTPSPEMIDLIQNHHIGGVILFSRNIESPHQLLALTHDLQQAAKEAGHPYPLLIATDQENGLVRRLGSGSTIFPGNMALGAIDSEQLTYDVAQATGEELRALGVNMNLAPVVDVNNNPANPVIGIRSFGENPRMVARLGAAALRGYHAAGIIATLKHFPGHGDTATDSHRALPVISASRERLDALELVPFQMGIEAGADCVMIGHVALPALIPGDPVPATISPDIIQGLLRERLGFSGVAISDCFEMDAIATTIGAPRASVLALRAGTDIVLVSHRIQVQRASIAAVRAAVASGELTLDAFRQAAERIMRLKQRYLAWDNLPTTDALTIVGSRPHAALRDQAYAASTTLVRDKASLLPLHISADEPLAIIVQPPDAINDAVDIAFEPSSLLDAIRHEHPNTSLVTLAPHPTTEQIDATLRIAGAARAVLLVTLNAHRRPEQLGIMRRIAGVGRPTIGIAVCDPYDACVLPEIGTFLATYEYSEPALAAAVNVIFGRAQAQGRLPVTCADSNNPY
ncbi:MAG: beta-N-acetylglucosaminidase [Ktedonobacterales bacterium]|nr:MAG: beta-N-acetylglucosaminidase [Ktedonobacterales bacterium]